MADDPTILDHLRTYLIAEGIVRAPDVAGGGARPWLPPVYRHEVGGAVGPGDAKDAGYSATAYDDGVVVNLRFAPGMTPPAGAEGRRWDGVDVHVRARSTPAAAMIDRLVYAALIGDPPVDPGGKTDWTMAGLYVIQSSQWKPWQAIPGDAADAFTFTVGYIFETRVA